MAKRFIKIFIAAALLVALLYRADWQSAFEQITRLSAVTFLGSIALLSFGLVLSAWKWSFALRMQELFYPFRLLLRVLCAGFFFNSFLPTAVGGDAYRVYRTLPQGRYRSRALAAVVVERAVGLAALLVIGGLGAVMLAGQLTAARVYCVALLAAAVTFAAALAAVKHGWLRTVIDRWRHLAAVDAILHSGARLRNQRRNWLGLLVLSLAFQMISIGVVFILFRDISSPVAFAQCALITAMVGVAAALPISINGIGVMEGTFVGVAVALGLDYEQALIVAFARRFIAVILSAVCGVAYIMELHRPDALRAEQDFRGFLRTLWARLPSRPAQAAFAQTRSAMAADTPAAEPDVPLGNFRAGSPGSADWEHSRLLEYTHDAIIIWEMDGAGILYWNQAAEGLYGYSRSEALGRTTHALLNTQLAGGVDMLETMLSRHGVWVGELRHTTRDGHQVEVQGRLALMSQHNGRWLILEVNRDVTDHKKAEAAQQAMAQQLIALRSRIQC